MTEEAKRREREAEIADVQVAIRLLEQLRDDYRGRIAMSGAHQRPDLERSLRMIERGMDPVMDGIEIRIQQVISDDRIAKFGLKPGLAIFQRRLQRLREEQKAETIESTL